MGKSRINRGLERREQLRVRAKQHAEARSARSPSQQLELLDERLGVGVGATKERERLDLEVERKRSTGPPPEGRQPKSTKRGERRKAKARRNDEREKRAKGGRRDV